MLKALPAGKALTLLDPVCGSKPVALFERLKASKASNPEMWANGNVPVFLVGSFGSPIEVSETGYHYCEECQLWTYAKPKTDPMQGWIINPCHEKECSCCYEVGTLCHLCEKVSDCCDCLHCSSCEDATESVCDHCDRCEECCCCSFCHCGDIVGCGECEQCSDCCSCYADRCSCSDCRAARGNGTQAPWIVRNDPLPTSAPVDVYRTLKTEAETLQLDPVQAMADFYLCDYVSTVLARFDSGYSNNGARNLQDLFRASKLAQKLIVQKCDSLFQDYVFAAIGGEVRHHGSVRGSVPAGRESMWDYWHAMGETIGRDVLTDDCIGIFGDVYWASGYGGKSWETISKTLAMRLDRRLDARSFVDRVFSLQHNGGSLLNKLAWPMLTDRNFSVEHMITIGNAHADATIGFATLLESCSETVLTLMVRLMVQAIAFVPASDRERFRTAMAIVLADRLPNWLDQDWSN